MSQPAAGSRLAGATLGVVQILWANDDIPELRSDVPALAILDEMHRLGYRGSQLGSTFPRGQALLAALRARDLRIAENYAGLPCTPDGPTDEARERGRATLESLHAAEGDVLVAALALTPDRIVRAGRAADPVTPRMSPAGFARLGRLLEDLARESEALGHRLVFHNHVGTYVETPDELDVLLAETDPALVGSCLDVGHYIVGGGDPVAALRRYGERVRHVHLKDVSGEVLARLRSGATGGFLDALRDRLFCEVGAGVLDVLGVLRELAARDYRGWIMIEQDTTWRAPSESAAISRGVYDFALRVLAGGTA